jgi:SARP family transcriptional regulator, regulator of embCAB operon
MCCVAPQWSWHHGKGGGLVVTNAGLEFGVLGPLQLRVAGAEVIVGAPKQRAVLAMLIINRNRTVSTESLLNAAWGDASPAGAKGSLHTYISSLRKMLAGGTHDARTVLVSAPPGYRLSIDETACDIGRFGAERTAGLQAAVAGRFEDASRHLASAIAEWRGAVLDDLLEFQFVGAFATALGEDKIQAQTARAEAEIVCGRSYAVIGELETLVVEHPYHEPLWAQLITAYYLSERQSEALGAYNRVKSVLAGDLGVEPEPALRELYDRILRQEPLDVKKMAQGTAARTITSLQQRTLIRGDSAFAFLRHRSGASYPLRNATTTIGRLADNDILLDEAGVSRHHAVIIDTGTSFVVTDLRSANGVKVGRRRIQGSVALADGDRITIGSHEFIFEIGPDQTNPTGTA